MPLRCIFVRYILLVERVVSLEDEELFGFSCAVRAVHWLFFPVLVCSVISDFAYLILLKTMRV